MFKGKYEYKIDSKGRISLPKPFKEALQSNYSGSVVITNFDVCLVVYPIEEWEILKEKAKSLQAYRDKVMSFIRFLYSGANECRLDNQGRILIPAELRRYAKLKKEVVLIGVSNRIEIWNKDRWQEYVAESKSIIDDFAHQIINLTEKL